jgi:hypothetical protein
MLIPPALDTDSWQLFDCGLVQIQADTIVLIYMLKKVRR